MTLELVDGVDLRSLLRSSPEREAVPGTVALIGMDLAYALEHAHATLVHRDISPSNILLSRSGEAKLADFGIAKAIDNARSTASRSAKGKIPYMSPEHMRAESVDGRADLFSLGVVLFEAVAGRPPFRRSARRRDDAEGPRRRAPVVWKTSRPDAALRWRPSSSASSTSIATPAPERPAAARGARRGRASALECDGTSASRIETQCGGPRARMHVRAREEDGTPSSPRASGRRTSSLRKAAAQKALGLARAPGTPRRRGARGASCSVSVLVAAAPAAEAPHTPQSQTLPRQCLSARLPAPSPSRSPARDVSAAPVPAPDTSAATRASVDPPRLQAGTGRPAQGLGPRGRRALGQRLDRRSYWDAHR